MKTQALIEAEGALHIAAIDLAEAVAKHFHDDETLVAQAEAKLEEAARRFAKLSNGGKR